MSDDDWDIGLLPSKQDGVAGIDVTQAIVPAAAQPSGEIVAYSGGWKPKKPIVPRKSAWQIILPTPKQRNREQALLAASRMRDHRALN